MIPISTYSHIFISFMRMIFTTLTLLLHEPARLFHTLCEQLHALKRSFSPHLSSPGSVLRQGQHVAIQARLCFFWKFNVLAGPLFFWGQRYAKVFLFVLKFTHFSTADSQGFDPCFVHCQHGCFNTDLQLFGINQSCSCGKNVHRQKEKTTSCGLEFAKVFFCSARTCFECLERLLCTCRVVNPICTYMLSSLSLL